MLTLSHLVVVALELQVQPLRVLPPISSSGTRTAFRPMWCAPSFSLDEHAPDTSRLDFVGVPGAFLLKDVLSREEASRMVAMTEKIGFDRDDSMELAGRRNGALSWVFHDELELQLARRMAPLLPWGVAVHAPGTEAPGPDRLPSLSGLSPWVRQVGGAPEGLYMLDGLNCRMRVYRYESDDADRFLPHHDEVWPGSRLVFGPDDGEPRLQQDSWQYAAPPHEDAWAWVEGDRVSQLTVLLYLNDDFEGGETVLYPHESPEDGIAVQPIAGSALCFGQSFKFNREGVEHSADALLHEGAPVASGSPKYVIRTDVCYTLPAR